jgi:transketolase
MGKAITVSEGDHITIIGSGVILADCLQAVDTLAEQNINARLLDMHTVKPIDEEAILKAARETGGIVTVEDVSVLGGLGGAVTEVVTAHHPVPVKRVGIKDLFGQTGTPDELKTEYEISSNHIVEAAKQLLNTIS